ncbi:MAG: sensor histidine kinase [Spirochaetaceae bacterium]
MNRIAVKLALFFFAIIVVSTFVSFVAVTFLSRQVADEVASDQLEIAESIQALRNRTDLPLQAILEIVSSRNYQVEEVASISLEQIGETERRMLEGDEIVSVGYGTLEGTTTIVRFGESFVMIRLDSQRNILRIWISRLWNTITLFVLISAALIVVLTNKVVHPILALTDATQRVARGDFDVQLDGERNDEIGRLTHNFNRMVQELKTIEYLRRDFISNVSHELKTPLASIQGYAALLRDDNLDPIDRRDYAGVIVQEATRLANMSSTMLMLSKLERQSEQESPSLFRLDEQIRMAIVILEPQWSAKRVDLAIELEPVDLIGTEDLLQQVWLNILANAIKFSYEGGRIEVALARIGRSARVTITDHGVGIAAEDLDRVFEKFFQVDRTRSSEGSGLGLSLVRRIVTLFGGTIDIESRPEAGTAITVTIPEHAHER